MTQPFFLLSDTFCGENKHLTPDTISWAEVIEVWYNESINFRYGHWSPVNDKKLDRYIQVTWEPANIHIS